MIGFCLALETAPSLETTSYIYVYIGKQCLKVDLPIYIKLWLCQVSIPSEMNGAR